MDNKIDRGNTLSQPAARPATSAGPANEAAAKPEEKPQSIRERFAPKKDLRQKFGLPGNAAAPARASAPSAANYERHVDVPFFSQFEGGHGYTPGGTACFKASSAMAAAAGAKVTSADQRIQIATSEAKDGTITADPKKAAEGRRYIDAQLDAGKPVVVGVSHKDGNYNADGITDHFVVITGRGKDEQGRTFYSFQDPGTKFKERGGDANPNNRLYAEDGTGKLYRDGTHASGLILQRRYEVSMVRKNA